MATPLARPMWPVGGAGRGRRACAMASSSAAVADTLATPRLTSHGPKVSGSERRDWIAS